jgi:hypothetical protein
MNHDPLNQALHALEPDSRPIPSFAPIRARIDPPSRARLKPWRWAFAASLVVAAGVLIMALAGSPPPRVLELEAANRELDYALDLLGAPRERTPEVLLAQIELRRQLETLGGALKTAPQSEPLLAERVALKRDLLKLSAGDPVAESALVDAVAQAVLAQPDRAAESAPVDLF